MKNIYKYLLTAAAAAILLFTSCKEDEETEGTTYFRFTETEVTVQKGQSGEIEISWERTLSRSARLEVVVSTDGIPTSTAAVQGTDYTVSETTLSFGNDDETKKITVGALAGLSGTKTFRLVMKSSSDKSVGLGEPGKFNGVCTVVLTQ